MKHERNGWEAGKTVQDDGFVSTSSTPNPAVKFALRYREDENDTRPSSVMVIHAPKGTNALATGGEEHEYILQHGSKFKIDHVDRSNPKITFYHMHVLPEDKAIKSDDSSRGDVSPQLSTPGQRHYYFGVVLQGGGDSKEPTGEFTDHTNLEAYNTSEKLSEEWKAQLTPEEQKAVNFYTYHGDKLMNGMLRGQQVWGDEHYSPPEAPKLVLPQEAKEPWYHPPMEPGMPFGLRPPTEPVRGQGTGVRSNESAANFEKRTALYKETISARATDPKIAALQMAHDQNMADYKKAKDSYEADYQQQKANAQLAKEKAIADHAQAVKEFESGSALADYRKGYNERNAESIARNTESYKKSSATLDEALKKGVAKENTILWRGVDKLLPGMEEGKTFTEKGYTSTSLSKGVAESFSGKDGIIMKIKAPAGTHVGYVHVMSDFKSEKEGILPHHTRYHIDKIEKNTGYGNKTLVYAHIVSSGKKNK